MNKAHDERITIRKKPVEKSWRLMIENMIEKCYQQFSVFSDKVQ